MSGTDINCAFSTIDLPEYPYIAQCKVNFIVIVSNFQILAKCRDRRQKHIKKENEMAKYLFVYHGGSTPETEQDVTRVMNAWGEWFGSMGSDVVDGGNPVGLSSTVNSDGSVSDDGGANPASGYSLIEASNLEDALAKAGNCPVLQDGGSVEVAEAIDM